MEFLLVGLGGVCGGLCRYQLGKWITAKWAAAFPLGTFLINITGAFLLGLLSSMNADENTYLLLGDGFLGAYTTFSTFMYEGFHLFRKNDRLNAIVYILTTVLLGGVGYIAGFALGKACLPQ